MLWREKLSPVLRWADTAAAAWDPVAEEDAAAIAAQHEVSAADVHILVLAVALKDRTSRSRHDRAGDIAWVEVLDLAAVLPADDGRGIRRKSQVHLTAGLGGCPHTRHGPNGEARTAIRDDRARRRLVGVRRHRGG